MDIGIWNFRVWIRHFKDVDSAFHGIFGKRRIFRIGVKKRADRGFIGIE
jgi:hypothetical protein